MKLLRRALMATTAVGALTLALAGPAPAADTSQDACHTVNNNMPHGDCGAFHQTAALNFNAVQVPTGAFSGCVDGSFACSGLKAKYPSYYAALGAYPSGWPDTAGNGADGNSGPVPGEYHPEKAVSVIKTAAGDGQLKVHMTSTGSSNSVAALVPRQCTFRYGKFTERTQVSSLNRRFKMAHLHYSPKEIDYPEAGGSFGQDPVSEFTHGFAESGADAAPNSAWTGWHTYSQEVVPGQVRFYFDGRLFKTVKADYPDATEWVLQNESALGVSSGYVQGQPLSVDIRTTWLTCYKYAG